MSQVSLTRLGAVLGIAAGVFLVCKAAFAADAVCNGTATSTALLNGAPVAWLNDSFTCAGTCNPGTCAPQQTGDDPGDPKGQTSSKNADCSTTVVTNIECRCPSGAGDAGCREIWEVTTVVNEDGSFGGTTSRMYCFGPCPSNKECEYESVPVPAGSPKKWSCKCQ